MLVCQFRHSPTLKMRIMFPTKLTKRLTNSILAAFLASRRQGISRHTLLFYHRCLSKAIRIELVAEICEFGVSLAYFLMVV